MKILGISAYYHDSAACLVKGGEIICAAQEERFTRVKHDAGFPVNAIKFCLEYGNLSPDKLDCIAYYEKPELKFERILKTFSHYCPKGGGAFAEAMSVWLTKKLTINKQLQEINPDAQIYTPEHHESHAMSAFYPSPFSESAIVTIDGVGEWATTTIGMGKGNETTILKEIRFPHSLGLLYSAFTAYTGFRVNSGEYKVMGLAPYGEPRYKKLIYDNLVDVRKDGSFHLNMEYFNYPYDSTMTNNLFHDLFGGPPRQSESELTQKEMDLSKSVQEVVEEIVLKIAHFAKTETGAENLCMAGGVSLNCVANGKLLKSGLFGKIWIQPASGDAGGALGAALGAWYKLYSKTRRPGKRDSMQGSLLGPVYKPGSVKYFLNSNKIPYKEYEDGALFDYIAKLLDQGSVIGWFQGKMEFGPRALGNRSILGDPRSSRMQQILNLKIKNRESFRPFAPAVLEEKQSDWFDISAKSPYMLLVGAVKPEHQISMTAEQEKLFGIDKLNITRSVVPAITHVDYSARVQSVHKDVNPKFHGLIKAFERITGVPILINTSFNVRGEPPVCSPEDAYNCFNATGMEYLVIGNCVISESGKSMTESVP